jgi:hypothetical protein
MVPFHSVIMISSPSARPYEHEPSPRPAFGLATSSAHIDSITTFFTLFKLFKETERSREYGSHDAENGQTSRSYLSKDRKVDEKPNPGFSYSFSSL